MFTKAVLLSAIATFAAAQSAVLTFTHVPNPVTDGQAQAITYATNDTTSPVTITLRKGLSTDLKTIETLTSSATSGQYVWTPSLSLPNGVDYALQISQGTQVNYFGPFVVQGASAYTSSSASMSASASASSNVTTTTATAVVPVGTIGTNSAGTGTALPRNTTMSMATLSSASSTGTPASTTATATSSGSGAGFQSATGSASASSSSSSASNIHIGSSIALFGAIAAAVFLQ